MNSDRIFLAQLCKWSKQKLDPDCMKTTYRYFTETEKSRLSYFYFCPSPASMNCFSAMTMSGTFHFFCSISVMKARR